MSLFCKKMQQAMLLQSEVSFIGGFLNVLRKTIRHIANYWSWHLYREVLWGDRGTMLSYWDTWEPEQQPIVDKPWSQVRGKSIRLPSLCMSVKRTWLALERSWAMYIRILQGWVYDLMNDLLMYWRTDQLADKKQGFTSPDPFSNFPTNDYKPSHWKNLGVKMCIGSNDN